MSNLILATPILSDAATITASTETTAGPVTNLQKMQLTDLWEAASTTPYCEIDLGSTQSFNLISLIGIYASVLISWRVRTATSQANLTAAPTHDSGSVSVGAAMAGNHIWYWYSGLSNRWVRIDLVTTSPTYVGRLYISNATEMTFNYQYGAQDGFDDDSIIDSTDGNNLIPNQGANRAVLDFTMNIRTEAERHAIREINRLRGAANDVLVIKDPAATTNKTDLIYYGLLQRRRQAVHTAFNLHNINYQLVSL